MLATNYFNRNRYYSPALGRFISKDPIGFNGGYNLYRYADNNPMRYTDPWGLRWSATLKQLTLPDNIIGHFLWEDWFEPPEVYLEIKMVNDSILGARTIIYKSPAYPIDEMMPNDKDYESFVNLMQNLDRQHRDAVDSFICEDNDALKFTEDSLYQGFKNAWNNFWFNP